MIFSVAQTVMALGTVGYLNPNRESDIFYAWLLLATFVTFVCVSIVLAFIMKAPQAHFEGEVRLIRPRIGIWLWIWISVAVAALYFQSIGYSALFEGIRGKLSGDVVDVATLRFESYSGTTYLFPGYVNQFKNALLPALTTVVVSHEMVRAGGPRRFRIFVLVLLSVFFLLGTGQRGAFVLCALCLLVFVSVLNGRQSLRHLLPVLFVVGALFMAVTFVIGRGADAMVEADSMTEALSVLVGLLFFRFLGSSQESAVAGFRYIFDQPMVGGSQWLTDLIGVLPGSAGSTLDNEIYMYMFGTPRGTAPPSTWASGYLNFGVVGTLVFAAVLSLILFRLSMLVHGRRSLNSVQLVGLAGIQIVFGFWVSGSPLVLLNTGAAVYFALWWIGGRLRGGGEDAHSPQVRSNFHVRARQPGLPF